jgi:PHD/YefM family antitoxin component YafN of YafNO toxin-antitoxin module
MGDQFITDAKGQKVAVIISIKQYQQMNEDLHDLSVIAERKNEKTVSFEEMKRKFLKKS